MKPRRTLISVFLLVLVLAPLFSGSVQADQQPPRQIAVPLAVTNTYTNNSPVAVPDGLGGCNGTPGAPATSTITVPDARMILDLNVGLNISATWVGDVIVRLTTPDGTTVTLVDRPGRDVTGCGYSSDNIVTTLDDASSGGLVEYGDPPTWPSYRPQEPLAFTGQNSAGTWTLTVIDAAAIAAVRLNSWSLIINGVVPPVAANDSASLNAGSAVAIPVTANDTDVDGTINPATVRIGTAPTCGTAVPNGAGGVLYTNTDTTCTTDTFTYTVLDDDWLTSNAAGGGR